MSMRSRIKIIHYKKKELATINAIVHYLTMMKMQKKMMSFAINIITIQNFMLSCQSCAQLFLTLSTYF